MVLLGVGRRFVGSSYSSVAPFHGNIPLMRGGGEHGGDVTVRRSVCMDVRQGIRRDGWDGGGHSFCTCV